VVSAVSSICRKCALGGGVYSPMLKKEKPVDIIAIVAMAI
jgi:hypothetical protein